MALPTFSAFVPSALTERARVAVDHIAFRIAATEDALAAFVRPGQFVKMRVRAEDGALHEGIFALPSAPFERRLAFVARTSNPDGGEAADRVAVMAIGAGLEVTLPAGDGFPLERARGRDLAFVCVGTAIAPVRSALEVVLRDRASFGALSLDYGLRSLAHSPMPDDLDRWRMLGVRVALHVSSPRADGTVDGPRAQDALFARLGPRTRGTAIVAVGHPALVADVRARVAAAGGDGSLVLVNH